MGLFDLFFRTNGARNGVDMKLLREPKSKYYRLVQGVAGIVLAVSLLVLVLALVVPSLNTHFSVVLKAMLVLIAISLGALVCLPWVNFLERDKRLAEKGEEVPSWRKKVCFAFFAAIGVVVVLWIIAVFVVNAETFERLLDSIGGSGEHNLVDAAGPEREKDGALFFLATAIVISLQVFVASFIAASAIRYEKKFLTIRIISYIGIVLSDIWVSWIVACLFSGNVVTFKMDGDTVVKHIMSPVNPNELWLVIGIISVVVAFVSGLILRNMVIKDRMRAALRGDTAALSATEEDFIHGTYQQTPPDQPAAQGSKQEKDAEEQLAKLKDLFDKGFITEEEYREKRQDILSKL